MDHTETDLLMLADQLSHSEASLVEASLSTEGQADRDAANLEVVKEWIH